jgi:hypothetical protein
MSAGRANGAARGQSVRSMRLATGRPAFTGFAALARVCFWLR